MIPAADLSTLYSQLTVDTKTATPLEKLVNAYVTDSDLQGSLIDNLLSSKEELSQASPWQLLDKWREFLALLLIAHDRNCLPSYRVAMVARMQQLRRMASWPQFQLLSAYQALAAFLLDHNPQEPFLSQMPSGACPVEAGGHWAWGDIPHPGFQAELGLLWGLYAELTGSERFAKAAENMAQWQLNTLDHTYLPFWGFFSQEGDIVQAALLLSQAIFFDAVAHISQRPELAFIAQRQHAHLSTLSEKRFPVPMLMLAAWFQSHLQPVEGKIYQLSEIIEDASLALAGCRAATHSAVGTLYGGGTGMGCFHKQDVQVVNFGPQHLPLGDCRGFGLEGAGRLLASRLEKVKAVPGAFELAGVARMAARPKAESSASVFRHGDPGGVWMDTRMNFQDGHLCLETNFSGIYEQKTLAFAFFVKAASCLIDGQSIKPRSFQQYQGGMRPVHFKGQHSAMAIEAAHKEGQMHVIPLGGGHNFWGADFLLAYHCQADGTPYRWHVG